MNVNPQPPTAHTEPPLMTETVSVRLTENERLGLERLANRHERTISNLVRRTLRTYLEQEKGTEQ